jgi:hypothetical protein
MTGNRTQHLIGIARLALVLVALVTTVTLTSIAAAAPEAGRQQVTIASKLYPQRTFVFTPLTVGALKRDSGRARAEGGNAGDSTTFTFKGRQGTLVIRELSTEWVDVLNEEVNGVVPAVVISRWNVVRGTGQYASVIGGGRSAQAGLGSVWYARQDGFLRSP